MSNKKAEEYMKNLAALLTIIITLCVSSVFSITGDEILAKMDSNRNHKTMSATATMEIYIGDEIRTKTMAMKGVAEGKKSIVEFINPEDKGTKYLMLDDNLWIYFPDEEDVIKISGHMLKEGMMGSDLSYEDALESNILLKKYKITLSGEEQCKDRACYVVVLDAQTKDAPYHRRKMWVDKVTFVAWKEEMYAKSGKLLKEANVLDVKLIGGRYFPVKSEMVNKLRKNSMTVFTMGEIELDKPMDENEFSMRYLRR
jgi:outer membrane lipoprotein-sorting protein